MPQSVVNRMFNMPNANKLSAELKDGSQAVILSNKNKIAGCVSRENGSLTSPYCHSKGKWLTVENYMNFYNKLKDKVADGVKFLEDFIKTISK